MSTNPERELFKDTIRATLAVTIGLLFSKYLNISFNFLIPGSAFTAVYTMTNFTVKKFLRANMFIVLFAYGGLFLAECLKGKNISFFILTFIIFFTSLFFVYKDPAGIRSGMLGYTFTTIYFTYKNKIVENMIRDLLVAVLFAGIISAVLLVFIPKNEEEKIAPKPKRQEIHKNVKNTFGITLVLSIIWLMYMFFDIRDTFFAYATLWGIYANLDVEKIHTVTYPTILVNVIGCFLSIVFSFFINGISNNPIIFFCGLVLLFYPIIYRMYFKNKVILASVVRGIIFPIALYLTPQGDTLFKSSKRGFQISVFLIVSMILTKIYLVLSEDED